MAPTWTARRMVAACAGSAMVATALVGLAPVPALAALAAPSANTAAVAVADTELSKAAIERTLHADVSEGGSARVIVTSATASNAQVRLAMTEADRAGDVSGKAKITGVPGSVTARIDQKALAELQSTSGISVEPDIEVPSAMTPEVPIVEADDMYKDGGTTGSNQVVAVIDTGVDKRHTWLANKIVTEQCFSGGLLCPGGVATKSGAGAAAPCALPGCDHGTHVAGTVIGGRATAANRGIAPGAKIIPIMAASTGGRGQPVFRTADMISALTWVFNNAAQYNIVAVNMSIAGPLTAAGGPANPRVTACGNVSAGLRTAIANLDDADIATVIAAGNENFAGNLDFPSCMPKAIKVAATTDADELANFSNRAPNVTLAAPGNSIRSAIPTSARNRSRMGVKSGTSMATPMVAGAIALLRQRFPGIVLDDIIAALRATATLISVDGGATTLRRINIHQAYVMLKSHPTVVDGSGGGGGKVNADVGTDTETIDYNGIVHRFWFDSTNANLRHMSTNGWGAISEPETLDGSSLDGGRLTGDQGRQPSAVVFSNLLHVFYRDASAGNLRHATFDGDVWSFENVETAGDVGGAAEAAVYNGQLNVFHYDRAGGNLRRCVKAGAWTCELIDGDANVNQRINANVGSEIESVNTGTGLYVFYRDDTHGNMRVAYIAPHRQSFNLEVLDGAGGGRGRTNANVGTGISAGTFLDRPVVFYLDRTAHTLRVARSQNAGWRASVVDGAGGNNGRTSHDIGGQTATAKQNGVMHAFYYDSTRSDLRVVSMWVNHAGTLIFHAGVLDGMDGQGNVTSGSIGRFVSAVTFGDDVQLTYQDETNHDARISRFGL